MKPAFGFDEDDADEDGGDAGYTFVCCVCVVHVCFVLMYSQVHICVLY